jgi:hypothetical protein
MILILSLFVLMFIFIFTNINIYYTCIFLKLYPILFYLIKQYLNNFDWSNSNDPFMYMIGQLIISLTIIFNYIKSNTIKLITKYDDKIIIKYIKHKYFLINDIIIVQNNNLCNYLKKIALYTINKIINLTFKIYAKITGKQASYTNIFNYFLLKLIQSRRNNNLSSFVIKNMSDKNVPIDINQPILIKLNNKIPAKSNSPTTKSKSTPTKSKNISNLDILNIIKQLQK